VHVSLVEALSSDLLLDLGFDRIESKVLPAMLGLELGERQAVLQVTSNLGG
jgi:hypothetical protein